jgi:hypothetical protein
MITHKTKRVSKVVITAKQDSLEINISGIVTARTLDRILQEIYRQKSRTVTESAQFNLIVDLSSVSVVRPSGAVGLVCLCSALMTKKMKNLASPAAFYLRHPPENVLTYLIRIGFFTQMSMKANLMGHHDMIVREEDLKHRDRDMRMQDLVAGHIGSKSNPIVWPIQLIGRKEDQRTHRDFEDTCQQLVNSAADHFDKLFSSSDFNFDRRDKHDFLLANYELYMNVYDHSESWGFAMIHARPGQGTYICCHDVGIGIRKSVNASHKIGKQLEAHHEAIKWALIEGNSSKDDGNGLGLNIIEEFVASRNGMIEIRSGDCLLQRTSSKANWIPHRVPWFPGVQINMFVPAQQD